MKRIILTILVMALVLSSCSFVLSEESEKGTQTAVPAEPQSEKETEPAPTESLSAEPALVEPPSTDPANDLDPESDLAEYREISARAGVDVRYGFVKGFIDGDTEEVFRSVSWDFFAGSNPFEYDEWKRAFDKYRGSFKITRYSCREETVATEYGYSVDTLIFEFYVYASENPDIPVGERRFDIRTVYGCGTAVADDHERAENSSMFSEFLPEEANRIVQVTNHLLDEIVEGYRGSWSRDNWLRETVLLLLPRGEDEIWPGPGLTAEQLPEAAKELYGVDALDFADPPFSLGDDGVYRVMGHGGRSAYYYLTSAEADGGGYVVTVRTYADKAHLIPSVLYEIRIGPGTRYYNWVIRDVKKLESGELCPFVTGQ